MKDIIIIHILLAQGRWFSPSTPASSTTKTGRHDIAEILLKVALNTKIQIQIHYPYKHKIKKSMHLLTRCIYVEGHIKTASFDVIST